MKDKTILQWFATIPDKDVRKKAIENLKIRNRNDWMTCRAPNLSGALRHGFTWRNTPEGGEFWIKQYNLYKALDML